MQDSKPDQERPVRTSEEDAKRGTLDLREILGMRHLQMMTIDVDKKLEEPEAAPGE